MPSPGRRTTPPPPRISSRHSPPGGRRRSPGRRPGPPSRGGSHMSRGGGNSGRPSPSRSRERRRSPPVHAQPPRHADNRSRPRRSRSPLPTRVRTPPPQRVRTPTVQRIRTPPPPAPLPRSFPVSSGGAKRKIPPKEQRGRMPDRAHENGAHRSSSRSVISPPRKMNRSRSPRPRQEIPLIGPADEPVPRDYLTRSSMTYSVAISPPSNKGHLISPPRGLSLTDRFRSESANVFKGADGEFNISELRNTRIHVIRKIPLNQQNLEHVEIDPANLSVVRRPELLGVDRRILEERGHYHPQRRSPRYSPPPSRYEPERFDGPSTSRDTRYNGDDDDYRPSREYDRPAASYDQRDNSRPERQGDDLRSQLEYRRDTRYSVERGRPQERGQDRRAGSNSDLRARLVEKRTDRHDDRSYSEIPIERERRPSPVERRRPTEFSEHVRHPSDSRHERIEPDSRRGHGEPELQRSHAEPVIRRGEFDSRRPTSEYESRRPQGEPEMRHPHGEPEMRRPHAEPEMRRPHGESSGRRPRGEFESRGSRTEIASRRRRASSTGRPPRETEGRRRRSRDVPSPPHYHGDPEEEYSDQPREWDSNPEHVPRGGLYFEHDNREEDIPHISERGRGRGMSRMRGSNYRGRGQRGGPMMRGGSNIRGVRLPFRGAPYPRGFIPSRGSRRGYPPPRSGRKSSPNWEHDMFDTLSDQPAN